MEFSVFAKKLKKIIGGASNNAKFTKTIFESMIGNDNANLLDDISSNTFKSYFNGHVKITKIAALVLANLGDNDEFYNYLNSFSETTAQALADEFKDEINDINAANASFKITECFLGILRTASDEKKSTLKSANIDNSLKRVQLPDKEGTYKYPYLDDDILLLREFTYDYDEIMNTLISDRYSFALLDITFPLQIKELYDSKWSMKANNFSNPTLKSYVFSLLGELKTLSEGVLYDNLETPILKRSRKVIRNLYVKLHPDKYSVVFPYNILLEDWDDGEI